MSMSINAKIPFQPGLALGSVVRGDIIEKMEEYGQIQAEIDGMEKKITILEEQFKALETKVTILEERKGSKTKVSEMAKSVDEAMIKLYKAQQTALVNQIQAIPAEITALQGKTKALPFFSNVSVGMESPFDFDKTTAEVEKRGFDTVSFSSQYIDTNESAQTTEDKMNQSSSASSAGAGVSFSAFSANVSHSWSSGAMERVAQIKNTGTASKILVINALVTTRNVRLLKNRIFDLKKLESIHNQMTDSANTAEKLNKLGITTIGDKKQVYLLTEAVMGGSFSAIVTYLKKDLSSRDLKNEAHSSSSATKAKTEGKIWGVTINGEFSSADQKANEKHSDALRNRNDLNVTIEFIAQGIIPKFARDTIVREVLKHQEQTLKKYESMGSDKVDEDVTERQVKLQTAMYESLSGVANASVEKEEISINTPETVMKAYDDFCGEIAQDTFGGVPVGFNYMILTESDIKSAIDEAKEAQKTEEEKKAEEEEEAKKKNEDDKRSIHDDEESSSSY